VRSLAGKTTSSSEAADMWRFTGTPAEFWQAFVAASGALIEGAAGVVLLRDRQTAAWRRIAVWPSVSELGLLTELEEPLGVQALEQGRAIRKLVRTSMAGEDRSALAVKLATLDSADACVAVFLVQRTSDEALEAALRQLELMAQAPAVYQERGQLERAKADVRQFSSVLDLLNAVGTEPRFMATAMAFCNELAARHGCEKVSLGWLETSGYVRLYAISHTEKFERKMDVVKHIEYAMEEALDQDDELVWPPLPGSVAVTREHEACATGRGIAHICTLPLRQAGKPIAAVTCERQSEAFGENDLRLLRLSCDMVTPRMADLRHRDRWFGARMATGLRSRLGRLVGVDHTWSKVAALLVTALVAVLIFGSKTYLVDGNFILKASDAVAIPATFDGYIDRVDVEVGDTVRQGDPLLALDTRELLLEEAAAAADLERYVGEEEKARAENRLADMRIAGAMSGQSKARLEMVRQRIARSMIRAPFDGIIVEGDLRERVGSPVRLGDPLFRLARLENLYVRMEVDESQIHEIRPGMSGRVAMISQPHIKFPVRVDRVDPVAVGKDQQNLFLLRCEFDGDLAPWLRPGMSGVGKVEVGRRNLLWIFTRRTADFLRLRFWW